MSLTLTAGRGSAQCGTSWPAYPPYELPLLPSKTLLFLYLFLTAFSFSTVKFSKNWGARAASSSTGPRAGQQRPRRFPGPVIPRACHGLQSSWPGQNAVRSKGSMEELAPSRRKKQAESVSIISHTMCSRSDYNTEFSLRSLFTRIDVHYRAPRCR